MISNNFYRGFAFRIVMGIMLVFLMLVNGSMAVSEISSCTTISSPGEYILNRSIINSSSSSCINITSSNVVFDGAGHTVDGIIEGSNGDYYGIYVKGNSILTNVTVKDIIVTNWVYGIYYKDTESGSIINTEEKSNSYSGIFLYSSNNIRLSGNHASNNYCDGGIFTCQSYGIFLVSSSNNTLINNNASNNYCEFGCESFGIFLANGINNTLSNNIMTGNKKNFFLTGSYNNQIELSNLVDGRPIFYLKNAINTIYDSSANAGTFYCIDCFNVTIKDMNLNNNGAGIVFWNTSLSRIENVSMLNNSYGAFLNGNNNTLIGNNASNNYCSGYNPCSSFGIYLRGNNNTLIGNNASKNYCFKYNSCNIYGIFISSSNNNILIGNNASDNYCYGFACDIYGIYLSSSNNSILKSNNVSNYYCLGICDLQSFRTGIYLFSSRNNTLLGNNALKSHTGIFLFSSNDNTLTDNNVTNYLDQGIYLESSRNNSLINNNASNGVCGLWYCAPNGIHLKSSSFNMLMSNNVSNNQGKGIYLYGASNNTLKSNNVSNNCGGGLYAYGIYIVGSFNSLTYNNVLNNCGHGTYFELSYNELTGNNISNNSVGIEIYYQVTNTILIRNNISNNSVGIRIRPFAGNNRIYQNNFINNTLQADNKSGEINFWDNGYPSGGNYWSNYTGSDFRSGPDQDIPGSDGIGDVPYIIDSGSWARDKYPFMEMNGWISQSLTVFVRGSDNAVWYRELNGTLWKPWQSLGGYAISNISSVTLGSDTYLFVNGSDRGVWYNKRTGTSWGGWQSLGGIATSNPDAVVSGADLYVFVRGSDYKLWYKKLSGGTWTPDWTSLEGYVTSNPDAELLNSELYVFVLGSDYAIWYKKLSGSTFTGWTSLGGNGTSDPSNSRFITHYFFLAVLIEISSCIKRTVCKIYA